MRPTPVPDVVGSAGTFSAVVKFTSSSPAGVSRSGRRQIRDRSTTARARRRDGRTTLSGGRAATTYRYASSPVPTVARRSARRSAPIRGRMLLSSAAPLRGAGDPAPRRSDLPSSAGMGPSAPRPRVFRRPAGGDPRHCSAQRGRRFRAGPAQADPLPTVAEAGSPFSVVSCDNEEEQFTASQGGRCRPSMPRHRESAYPPARPAGAAGRGASLRRRSTSSRHECRRPPSRFLTPTDNSTRVRAGPVRQGHRPAFRE